MNTGAPGGASPWRIKVTVQAEPGIDSNDENMDSPTGNRLTRTTTTTVPLKDADASSPVKRRGRPRKSDAEKSTKTKRSGTPVRAKSKPRARKSSVGVSDASAADLSTDAAPKKRRGRPRKIVQPTSQGEEAPTTEEHEHRKEAADETTPNVTAEVEEADPTHTQTVIEAPPGPAPKMPLPVIHTTVATPEETPLAKPTLRSTSLMPPSEHTRGKRNPLLAEYEEPIMFDTPPETDLSRRLRARKGTPHSKVVALPPDSSNEEDVITPSSTEDDEIPDLSISEYEALLRAAAKGPISAQIQPTEDNDYEEVGDATNYALDEGITRMPDDTTILDSENFSMVSVDSLPSSAGLSSPAIQQPTSNPAAPNLTTNLETSYLQIPRSNVLKSGSSPGRKAKSYPAPLRTVLNAPQTKSSPLNPRSRQRTPIMQTSTPSDPPAIEPTHISPTEVETPKIGRVVKAGVALQGVLDPDRITPIASSSREALDAQRDSLDDLFRGFSEGTRRQLHAGLKLGEQLATQNIDGHPSRIYTPALSSPIKPTTSKPSNDDPFCPRNKQRTSRLLTPEDQDDYTLPLPPPTAETEVKYPSLRATEHHIHLVSPARSEGEMSWRLDTPPIVAQNGKVQRTGQENNGQEEQNRAPTLICIPNEHEREDYSDIWQEEASRSSDLPVEENSVVQPEPEKHAELQDLFDNDGPVKPARGKLPRTWRRKSSSDFNYSDEVASPVQQATPSSSEEAKTHAPTTVDKGKGRLLTPESSEESDETEPVRVDKGKGRMSELQFLEEQYIDDEENTSEGSDDTGMFFQSNLPHVFNKRRSNELRKRRSEKLDVSLLLEQGESLLPESSPIATSKTPFNARSKRVTPTHPAALRSSSPKATSVRRESVEEPVHPALRSSPPTVSNAEKPEYSMLLDDGESVHPESSPAPPTNGRVSLQPHPFRSTPPRFTALQSPVRSSPLRQEIRASDTEDSHQEGTGIDESALPESSPFHTYVDNTSVSTASHEQQFRQEMEGATDSSIRYLREQADAHANAYESQYRTLEEIEEVTERSRSVRSTVILPSSPPTAIGDSILRPRREYSPLFSDGSLSSSKQQLKRVTRKVVEEPTVAMAPRTEKAASTGIFGRLTSTLWSAFGTSAAPPHPAAAKFDKLPKVEPWTKTHYKTLDALYQMHKKQPTQFARSSSSMSNTNDTLLAHFLNSQEHPFVGAVYSSWGYSVTITEPLVVLCAVFMQLLTFEDFEEYERVSGKKIQLGECNPGVVGTAIDGAEVVRRLASVIMGEVLRRDEKKGKKIVREGGMTIEWPN